MIIGMDSLDIDGEISDWSNLFESMMELPEVSDEDLELSDLLELADLFGLSDMLGESESDGDDFDDWMRRRSDGKRKRLPEFFKTPSSGFDGMTPGDWVPDIPHDGWKDSGGWAYRKKCLGSNVNEQSDTPGKCEMWFWDGEDWKGKGSDDENDQNWSGDGKFQFG